MLAKLEILSNTFSMLYKKVTNVYLILLAMDFHLFAFTALSSNRKLALWLLQLLQMMICFGNSLPSAVRSWQLPLYMRIHDRSV